MSPTTPSKISSFEISAPASAPPSSLTSASPFSSRSGFPWWVQTIVILGAALLAAGAMIALIHPVLLVSPHDEINGAVRIFAGYLFSRNIALAILLLAALLARAKEILNGLLILNAFVQLFDAIMDFAEGRWPIVPGVLILAVLFDARTACEARRQDRVR